jgi:protein-S-isoprenylcysteine O-methyltransferase Ste14
MAERPAWWKGTRGEWWVVGQGILFATIALAPPAWRWSWPARSLWLAVGAVLMIVGVSLAVRGILDLGSSGSPFPRPSRRAVLVETGLYARVRHPIYGGLIVASAGWALARTSGLHLIFAALLGVYMHAKAGREELFLIERFPEYRGYRRRTKRLLPWIF